MAIQNQTSISNYEDLIEAGKERGHVTFEDIFKALDGDATASDMDALLEELEEHHISVIKTEDQEATAEPVRLPNCDDGAWKPQS